MAKTDAEFPSKVLSLGRSKWPSWTHFHALGRLRTICWRCWEGPRWAQNLIKNGSKTVLRGEAGIFNSIENSQGSGASEGVQDAPKSVPGGFQQGSVCIPFATQPLEARESEACKIAPKIVTKNDQKWLPKWSQNEVKNRSKNGLRNDVHLEAVLGPSWDRFWTIF